MILHLAETVDEGYHNVLLRTIDTDVVVLGVAAAAKFNIQKLWVAFGTGLHLGYIPAHGIAAYLCPSRTEALSIFHAYTGCDTVSSFAIKVKKRAWDT